MSGPYRAKRAALAFHSISHQQQQRNATRSLFSDARLGRFSSRSDAASSQAVLGCTILTAVAACALSLNEQDKFALGRQHNLFHTIQQAVMQEAADEPLASTSFHEKYLVDWKAPELGYGAFGTVHLAHDKTSHEAVAIKLVDKNQHIDNVADESTLQEIRALTRIEESGGHAHVVGLLGIYEDEDHHAVVLDLAKGGEVLEDLLHNEKDKPYTPAEAARLIHQLASALDFLHNKVGLVHADVKPENLLLQDDNRSNIALADFGSASFICKTWSIWNKPTCPDHPTSIGTTAYWSPERFQEASTHETLPQPTTAMDMWSVGIVFYTLLTQEHPFDATGTATSHQLRENIMKCQQAPKLPKYCAEAQPVLDGLLNPNPRWRMTAAQLMKHPWVLKHVTAEPTIVASEETK